MLNFDANCMAVRWAACAARVSNNDTFPQVLKLSEAVDKAGHNNKELARCLSPDKRRRADDFRDWKTALLLVS